jgi:hypothetical protein
MLCVVRMVNQEVPDRVNIQPHAPWVQCECPEFGRF